MMVDSYSYDDCICSSHPKRMAILYRIDILVLYFCLFFSYHHWNSKIITKFYIIRPA